MSNPYLHPYSSCAKLPSGEAMVLACFLSRKFIEISVEISPGFCYKIGVFYAHVQGLRIRAGRPIHEMRTSHIFDGKGLDSHAE